MKHRSRWERSPGWVVQGLGTAALLALTGGALWLLGWTLTHVPNAVGYVAARLR